MVVVVVVLPIFLRSILREHITKPGPLPYNASHNCNMTYATRDMSRNILSASTTFGTSNK